MLSVCLEGIGKVSMIDRPKPVRKSGEALMKIKACAVCGSDIKALKGLGTPIKYPIILGHEAVADIIEIDDDDKSGLKIGDRVVLRGAIACGKCVACSYGKDNCCENFVTMTGVLTDGCMSEFFAWPTDHLVKVPLDEPFEKYALVEPFSVGLHAVHRTSLKSGEHVAIIGAGGIGVLTAMAAMAYGATAIMIDIVDSRLEFARDKLGIPYVINPAKEDAEARIREITNGRLADVVIEATGIESCITDTTKYVSYCGRVALIGWPSSKPEFDTFMITRKELGVFGSRNHVVAEFDETIELIRSGKVDVLKIVTKTVPLEKMAEALLDLRDHPEDNVKVLGMF